MNENPQSNIAWKDRLTWFKSSSQYRALDTVDGEPMEFEWNIFTGFTTLQLCYKVQEFMSKMSVQPEDFTGRIIFMPMFNDTTWRSKENKQECELSAELFSIYAERFSPGRWSFFGPGSEKKWFSTHENKPQGEWDRVAELMMFKFCESRHPVFRSTSPLSRGAEDKLSKFCMNAGFLNVVEIGQYFRTKDTADFSQFTDAVAYREYTLPRDEEASQPKGWIQGNTKIGPVLKVATCCLHGKYGVEIGIMSMNGDNSHSCVRISHGLSKLVTNLNNNEQET